MLKELLKKDPLNVDLTIALGELLKWENKLPEMFSLYLNYLTKYGDNFDIYKTLGDYFYKKDK